MAGHSSWHKELPEVLSDFRDREMIWLWLLINDSGHGESLNADHFNSEENRALYLISSLKQADAVFEYENIRQSRAEQCPSKSVIDWIKTGDRRLLNWLYRQFMFNRGDFGINAVFLPVGCHLGDYDAVIGSIDSSKLRLQDKISAIGHLQTQWATVIASDKHMKWMNLKDEDQCDWLYEYALVNNFSSNLLRKVTPRKPIITSEDKINYFLEEFDSSGLAIEPKRTLLQDLKARWNRRVRDADSDLLQLNVRINKQAMSNVKKLAKAANMKLPGFVEFLIRQEMERNFKARSSLQDN